MVGVDLNRFSLPGLDFSPYDRLPLQLYLPSHFIFPNTLLCEFVNGDHYKFKILLPIWYNICGAETTWVAL